jgi:hypothetical protein
MYFICSGPNCFTSSNPSSLNLPGLCVPHFTFSLWTAETNGIHYQQQWIVSYFSPTWTNFPKPLFQLPNLPTSYIAGEKRGSFHPPRSLFWASCFLASLCQPLASPLWPHAWKNSHCLFTNPVSFLFSVGDMIIQIITDISNIFTLDRKKIY